MAGQVGPSQPEIDLASPQFLANPYPVYQQLRRTAPVWWSPQLGCWLITRYAEAVAVLRDVTRFSSTLSLPSIAEGNPLAPFVRLSLRWLLFQDPPQHTQERAVLQKAFVPHAVEDLRPRLQSFADDLLDRTEKAGRMDLLWDFAFPLTARLLAEMLVAGPEDRTRIAAWMQGIARGNAFPKDAQAGPRGRSCVVELTGYLRQLTARRRQPSVDLLSAFLSPGDQLCRLENEAVCAQLLLVLFAGNETTPNLIGNGILALLHHPEQMRQLRQRSAPVSAAVEELLRYDSPVQGVNRQASADVVLCGQRIRQGDEVVVLLGSANRDPDKFADPDRLDLGREDPGRLAFGQGIHFCLGAALARLTAEVAIATLLRRLPDLRPEHPQPAWRGQNLVARGLSIFPVLF